MFSYVNALNGGSFIFGSAYDGIYPAPKNKYGLPVRPVKISVPNNLANGPVRIILPDNTSIVGTAVNGKLTVFLSDDAIDVDKIKVTTTLADYSAVDEAIKKANALNKNDYTNFTAVENAINAVVYNKDFTEQDEVDAMAKAINDAINSLKKKSTDASEGAANVPTGNHQTGDNSNIALWIILMLASLAVAGSTAIYRNKRKTAK